MSEYTTDDVIELIFAARMVIKDIDGFLNGHWDNCPENWEAIKHLLEESVEPFKEID